ncbi:MAG: hypothetical protein WD711_12885 [Dongiaceae bacterium]
MHSNYTLFQTDLIEGETKLFVTEKYEDRIVFEGDRLLFKSKLVIVDTYSIPNLLATPILGARLRFCSNAFCFAPPLHCHRRLNSGSVLVDPHGEPVEP